MSTKQLTKFLGRKGSMWEAQRWERKGRKREMALPEVRKESGTRSCGVLLAMLKESD